MTAPVWLNRRHAAESELPAIERAIEHEREKGLELLAGVLTAEPVQLYAGRTVDDLPVLP